MKPPEVAGYAISKLLGAGGFGAVWGATSVTGARVALKIGHTADANSVENLRREAEVLTLVGAPHVPCLYERGALTDGRPFIAMEHLLGVTLAEEMEKWVKPPSLSMVHEITNALLESAAVMHDRGVLHRDFKPENIFLVNVDGKLVAKLMDFGLARSAHARALGEATAVAPGAGTPEYMSPEQIAGKQLDPSSDVYSLGVMFFELLTLRPPFVGERRELEYAHLSLRPPRPSRFTTVPDLLEQVILRCLAKEPTRRFADAEALRVALEQAFELIPETSNRYNVPAAPAPGDSAAPAPLRASERQKVALLFAQGGRISGVELQAAVEPFGGQLASASLGKCACAFTYRAGNNPGQRALAAAEALIAKNLAERVIVDVGSVVVRPRPNGPPRIFSPLLTSADRYPAPTDPPGILLSAAASAMLPAVPCEPSKERPNYFVPVFIALDDPTAHSRTVIQDAPAVLVGRAEIMRTLSADVAKAISDKRPRVGSVLAAAGLGKSRLALELAHAFRGRFHQAAVLELRAREPLGRDADEALAELLRRALELPPGNPPDGGRELLADRLGEVAKDVYAACALLLGWIPPSHPAVQALRAAPGVLRANVAKAGMAAIQRLAKLRPVLILLDDAHWADDALLDALEQATVSELPLWICAFGRPVFAENRPTWGERAANVLVERLAPLSPESAAELCRQLLRPATHISEPVINRLVERSEAVPLLLCDLVRGLKQEGLVRKRAGEVWYVATEVLDQIPDSPLVEWIAGRELDELPAELSAHARLASLLSPEFTVEEIEGVLGAMDAELSDSFPMDARVGSERLKQTQLLVEHRGARLSFRNALTREAVAATVAEPLTVRIHQAALAYYRAAPLPESTRLPSLARHAAAAGERAEAAATYAILADLARERHNYLEAELHYTRVLAELNVIAEEQKLLAFKGRGIVRYRQGRYDGSLADLAQARLLASELGDPMTLVDVMLDESMALDWLFEWRRSRELAEQARELAPDLTNPALRARILLALGRSSHRFNHDREAADLLREAAQIAETIGDEGYEVEVAAGLLLGFLLPFLGLLDEAEERLKRANIICEQKGDELHLAALWNNRSCLWIARNDRERFMSDTGRVLAYGRRMGNANLERNANLNSAYFLYWRAEFQAAEPFVRRAIEIDEHYFREGGFRPEGAVLLARILWGAGAQEQARQLVTEVREHQQRVRAEGKSELLLQPNDELLLDMITLVVMGGERAEWEKIAERASAVAQGQELIEILEVAGVAALGRGDREGAQLWFRKALDAGRNIPNVMQARVQQRLSEIDVHAVA